MYWFYSDPGWGLAFWLVSMGLMLAGGWLIATHLFALEARERVLAGFCIGLITYLWLVNWIGRVLPPFWAFMGAGVIVLLSGLIAAYPFRAAWIDLKDWNIGGWLAVGFALGWLFFRVSKGTGLFDEYKNLALISTLANGWIPALAYFGQSGLLRYHYGFHLFGAGMMQLGHLMPWSAFDLSKAIVWSASLLMAGLIGRRYLPTRHGPLLLGCAVALAGGTRYLLLLLPSGLLSVIQQHVTLTGIASGTLIDGLRSNLPIAAGPNIGYPFAFLSGVNSSYVMAHGGAQTLEPLVFMLAILLMERAANRASIIPYSILFSFWALASETSMVLFAVGWGILAAWRFVCDRSSFLSDRSLLFPTIGLLLSVPLILMQGGTISAMAQQWLPSARAALAATHQAQTGPSGFSFRWPPAIVSRQLGQLPVADPFALFAGILEIGPAVLLLPWLTLTWWQKERDNWLPGLLVLISWFGLLIPLFLRWESEQDVSHITDFGADISVILLVFMLARMESLPPTARQRGFIVAGYLSLAAMCVPGVVLMGIQLTAAPDTILSEHYGDAEALLAKQAWGKLPLSSKMLGSVGEPSILTGQLTAGIYSLPAGAQRPVWEALLAAPKLSPLIQDGFDFVFVDWRWWYSLDPASQHELANPCATVFARGAEASNGKFVEILDLRACR